MKVRDHHRCMRCLVPAPTGQWHHRRSRSVRDQHQHCPCNGVWLCPTCHRWVHDHPVQARETGFIVSKFVTEPGSIPIVTNIGERWTDCQGRAVTR